MDKLSDAQLEGWIPIRLYWRQRLPMVDWCYFGRRAFNNSFFDQTIEECLGDPFNQVFRRQTPISVLGDWQRARPGLMPTGFIFHLSRSGSTLVSQLLAALPKNIVISEAHPIDSTLRCRYNSAAVTDDHLVVWLRWMISALFQQRLSLEQYSFIKFDAWHILELDLIRRAFPEVPWVFVYRDPIEVLVSQMDHRGVATVPGVFDPSLFGIDRNSFSTTEPEEYCARVLASLGQAALANHANGGLLINYAQLPEAVWSSISAHFGVRYSEAETATMKERTRLHAKVPETTFHDDSANKQGKATEKVRAAARQWLYPIYNELEAARRQGH
jgi:hypothetical protein